MTNKVYIYNPLQASFYITNGMRVLDTGVHHKTKKAFWVFDFNETEEIYSEWCNRKHWCKKVPSLISYIIYAILQI